MRLFLALLLPPAIQTRLYEIQNELRPYLNGGKINWVQPQNCHITLHFLGDTSAAKTEQLKQTLTHLPPFDPLTLQLSHIGCFPSRRRPRQLWIGTRGEQQKLQTLYAVLATQLQQLGWAGEKRPFHPHITIGRVKQWPNPTHFPWQAESGSPPFTVPTVSLISSKLYPSGPTYTIEHSIPLTGRS